MSFTPRFALILNGMAVAILIATFASYRIAASGLGSGAAAISHELLLLPIQVSASAQDLACARLSCVIAMRAELDQAH